MTEQTNGRILWKDAYDLVQDLREEQRQGFADLGRSFESHVAAHTAVDERHDLRIRALESDKDKRDSARAQIGLIAKVSDRTLAVICALSAVAMGIVSLIRNP